MRSSQNKKCLVTGNPLKSPCIMKMSNINFGLPDQLFRSYKHSRCAEIFHQKLKEKAGIEAVATFAYGDLKLFSQMQLFVWVQDSAAAEQILQNTPYQSCRRDHPLFQTVIDCLLHALQEDDNQALTDISGLWDMQQLSDANGEDKIYISMTFLSYVRCYIDELLGATKEKVSQVFSEHFPSYDRLMCGSFSLEPGPLAHNHLYLFMTPQDQKRAETSGDIEKMRKLAYDVIRAEDVYGHIPYEMYTPQITNRRELTSDQIFFIVRE